MSESRGRERPEDPEISSLPELHTGVLLKVADRFGP
jgi:hypothetical protein